MGQNEVMADTDDSDVDNIVGVLMNVPISCLWSDNMPTRPVQRLYYQVNQK
jgi:hypothetical protein